MPEQDKNRLLYEQEVDRQLRSIFAPYINPDFLVKIKNEILKDPRLRTVMNRNKKIFASNLYNIVNRESIDYIVARNIAMIHWYWTIPLIDSPEKIDTLYNNDNYIEKLKNQVILQFRIRKDFDYFNDNYQLVAYNPIDYTFRALTYHLFGVLFDLSDKINKVDIPNKNYKIDTLFVMLDSIRSILILSETRSYGGAYALFRSLIQTFASYVAIGDNEEAAQAYADFTSYQEKNARKGRPPAEFYKVKPKIKDKKGNEYKNKYRFLDYGWLDKVGNQHTDYTLRNLFNYCDYLDNGLSKFLFKSYKDCNKFVHGTYSIRGFDRYSFLSLLSNVGVILYYIAKDVEKICKKPLTCEGINLIDEYKKAMEMNEKIASAYLEAQKNRLPKSKNTN